MAFTTSFLLEQKLFHVTCYFVIFRFSRINGTFIEFVPFKCVIMYAFVGLFLQQRNIKVDFFSFVFWYCCRSIGRIAYK